mmetsp:Transcript_18432/g.42688  ORF Transcript_18432/g.42688 Transcript_18432/m.42688 type:complete len:153 (-) Transcript_18432:40-498(-)
MQRERDPHREEPDGPPPRQQELVNPQDPDAEVVQSDFLRELVEVATSNGLGPEQFPALFRPMEIAMEEEDNVSDLTQAELEDKTENEASSEAAIEQSDLLGELVEDATSNGLGPEQFPALFRPMEIAMEEEDNVSDLTQVELELQGGRSGVG